MQRPKIPKAPMSIQKGVPLKNVISPEVISCMAVNIAAVYPSFDQQLFSQQANDGLEPLTLMQRGEHIAVCLFQCLPKPYAAALEVLLESLGPLPDESEEQGLAVFYYLAHSSFIATYGLEPQFNDQQDPFELSMAAQYTLTQYFSAEFCIRPFLIQDPQRTLAKLEAWLDDPKPDIRRLCSEGTRPKLPWGKRIQSFVKDPSPILPILETLKDDPSLYVRRSVANSLGDIGKDHPQLVLDLCERWLLDADKERKWLIRHALRYWAIKGDSKFVELRAQAK
ncbi:DNA alkylation repair protein [Alginatibacterium sediminis]|uniref:DNA alkylation repair protein n=1 Tax=Alginatibacterium sediminis TaxID=2164068 RepID=A0A420EDQ5_9ALTE|nr:DNA alkylation repair protein [Alginatibacterium sediminis]RKF18762.1 DNA alkylation repair protein [Alginatibacterium sediminis]